MAGNKYELDQETRPLLEVFDTVRTGISWGEDAMTTFDLIKTAYALYNRQDTQSTSSAALMSKLQEVERYLVLGLECHIALQNGRPPFYYIRIDKVLQRTLDAIQSLEGDAFPDREFDHQAAEMQVFLVEYGLCAALDNIYHVDEASMKLDAASTKIGKLEKCLHTSSNTGQVFVDLHEVVANLGGIKQSMTEENIARLQRKFSSLQDRVAHIHDILTHTHVSPRSDFILRYLAGQHLLRRPMLDMLYHRDCVQILNDHMIHQGTRGWILERIGRWLETNHKRVFFLAGKHGSGKTALAATTCKLFNNTVTCHFFSSPRGNSSPCNTVSGLIQNLAHGLCQSLPEYLNYLDDKLSGVNLKSYLNKSWKESYDVLLREPLQALYGVGRSSTPYGRRRLIVIDGLDECLQDEWKDLQDFLTTFIKETSACFCFFITVRNKFSSSLMPHCDIDALEGIRVEDRAWINRHIKDIEIYLSTSIGAILSGEDETDIPSHAKADITTLQNAIDELLKSSAGRFDYAVEIMETFALDFRTSSGQFLGSLKKAMVPVQRHHGNTFEQKIGDFASPYRAYRDKEGRSVDVRVMRQSHYLVDKTRVAFIRGRHHRILELSQNGK